ncbi:MAG: protein kinase domain-containing protein, partial [Candidatus Limnocylindrales bacterium]
MAEIGRVIGSRYRLLELLGEGGMATIYRAHDGQLERDVALKLLRPEYGRDPDFVARFRQEAHSVASLSHPNIVSVFDFGTDPAGPFIVMEYVQGEDLASLLRRNGPLPPRRAARLTAEAARALEAAHERGIVHRDVKPSNVLLASDGRVKVVDFGIARALSDSQLTLPGTTLGSVHYFSPEQARGEQTTPASDIYALGILLYELLAGRRPWEGDSAASIALARLHGPAPMVSEVRAGVPPVLEAIDRKAMALEPEARFTSAGAMADALDGFLADRGTVPGIAPVAGTAAAAAAAAGAAGVARPNPAARVPYADDAFARGPVGPAPVGAGRRQPVDDEEAEDGGIGGGPWVWVAGGLGLLILLLAGFLV